MITGAAGFSGTFLTEYYAGLGWQVHGTFRGTSPPGAQAAPNIYWHHIDLTDFEADRRLVCQVRPTVVHHLAAQSSVSQSWGEPVATFQDNVVAQFGVLEAVVALGSKPRVLVVGSADEYGAPGVSDQLIKETTELLPLTPYGLSKVAQDLMGYQYFVNSDLPVVRVRPFLQIGPRRSDRFFSGSFAKQVAQIELGLREPVIEVGDIDQVRDMTDVRDVVRAYSAAVENGDPGDVYNIASGQPRTLREFLTTLIEIAGIDAEIRQVTTLRRSHEPARVVGDGARLKHAAGWQPSITFVESVRDSLQYWRDRFTAGIQKGETN